MRLRLECPIEQVRVECERESPRCKSGEYNRHIRMYVCRYVQGVSDVCVSMCEQVDGDVNTYCKWFK